MKIYENLKIPLSCFLLVTKSQDDFVVYYKNVFIFFFYILNLQVGNSGEICGAGYLIRSFHVQ